MEEVNNITKISQKKKGFTVPKKLDNSQTVQNVNKNTNKKSKDTQTSKEKTSLNDSTKKNCGKSLSDSQYESIFQSVVGDKASPTVEKNIKSGMTSQVSVGESNASWLSEEQFTDILHELNEEGAEILETENILLSGNDVNLSLSSNKENSDTSEVKKGLTDSQYDKIFDGVLESAVCESTEEKSNPAIIDLNKENSNVSNVKKGLTDSQYDTIFDAVIKSTVAELNEEFNLVSNRSAYLSQRSATKELVKKKKLKKEIIQGNKENLIKKPKGEKLKSTDKNEKKKKKKNDDVIILDGKQNIGCSQKSYVSLSESQMKDSQKDCQLTNVPVTMHRKDSHATPNTDVDKEIQHENMKLDEETEDLQLSQTRQAAVIVENTPNVLSQPDPALNQRERLEWLQQRRLVGIWVMCCVKACSKWRYLPHITDPLEIPQHWYCTMNPDKAHNLCSAREDGPSPLEEEELIHNTYTCGSIVWAKMAGFPWWPGMVDDDPDLEQYYWLEDQLDAIPTRYHVVFFDDKNEVSRAWLSVARLQHFQGPRINIFAGATKSGEYSHRLKKAMEHATAAKKMNVRNRLKKFSFLARFEGELGAHTSPKSKLRVAWKWEPHRHLLNNSHSSSESDGCEKTETRSRKRSVSKRKPSEENFPSKRAKREKFLSKRAKREKFLSKRAKSPEPETLTQDLFQEEIELPNKPDDVGVESDSDVTQLEVPDSPCKGVATSEEPHISVGEDKAIPTDVEAVKPVLVDEDAPGQGKEEAEQGETQVGNDSETLMDESTLKGEIQVENRLKTLIDSAVSATCDGINNNVPQTKNTKVGEEGSQIRTEDAVVPDILPSASPGSSDFDM